MQIRHLSTALPETEYSTEELADAFPCELPESVRKNAINLGVSKRRLITPISPKRKQETLISEKALVNLCLKASQATMQNAGFSSKDVGYLITTYDACPFVCPGLSHLLIRRLGFTPYMKHVNVQGMACASFTKALQLADDHLARHPNDNVLLCSSGVNSYWLNNQLWGLRNLMGIHQIRLIPSKTKRQMELRKWIATMEFFLFGDGVASCIVTKDGDGLSVDRVVDVTNLRKNDYMTGYARITALDEPFKLGIYSHLDGKLPKLGVKYTAKALERLLGKNVENSLDTIEKWVIHTGSRKILDLIADRYSIQPEKLSESRDVLRDYGNLSGASLPFILEKAVSKSSFSQGDIILMLGYGWGFSASACLLKHK